MTGGASALRLRDATPVDAALVERLTLAAYAEYRGVLVPESGVFSESLEEIRDELARDGGVIVEQDGEPVACARFAVAADRSHLYIGRLAVLPGIRRRGVARAMLLWLEDRARTLALPEVQLGVRLALQSNIRLYESAGYVVVGYEDRPEFGRISAWMRKPVDADTSIQPERAG